MHFQTSHRADMVGPENIPNVTAATAAFHSNVTDPKAAIITAASLPAKNS